MKKLLSKMDVIEIMAGSVGVGMLVAFVMCILEYVTMDKIFLTAGLISLVVIPYIVLCVLMAIILICIRQLEKKED